MRYIAQILILIILGLSCHTNSKLVKEPIFYDSKILSGDSIKYWDTYRGASWVFRSDSTMREYYFKGWNQRKWATYGDVILEDMDWRIKNDTLKLYLKTNLSYSLTFTILKLSDDSLILIDHNKLWGFDTLYHFKSPDQVTTPK